jgi:hypothetical protein
MNRLTHLKQIILTLLVTILLAFFGLLPQIEAAPQVAPAPDGCYPGFTTAEGCNALHFLTTGAGNTGVGWYSLYVDTTANYNTGVGAGTLVLNTADQNTAVGTAALLLNTTGLGNTAVGTDALVYNDNGSYNNAVGAFALFNNIDGFDNNAFGDAALSENIHASDNTAIGDGALRNNDVTGAALANGNTAVGSSALFGNTDGASNTAVGDGALDSNINGFQNTAIGAQSLTSNATGINNTALGLFALGNTTGQGNIGVGAFAGQNLTTGDFNIDIFATGVAGESNTIRIGNATQTATFIAGISGAVVPGGVTVIVDAGGHLGTVVSSQRFKDEIKPMDKASEAILALKPVTFRYKREIDPKSIPQFGLVAEDVAKVDPDLVARDAKGDLYTVRYEAVNAMLLNEFLKEHRKVEQQQTTVIQLKSVVTQQQKEFESKIALQQKQIEALTAGLRKVSAQVQLSKPAPQTVANNR